MFFLYLKSFILVLIIILISYFDKSSVGFLAIYCLIY